MTAPRTPMRVVLCTKRDLAGALVLNQVLPKLVGDEVVVLLSDKTRPVEKDVPELAEMKFLERDLPVDTLFPLIDRDPCPDTALATFEGVVARYGVEMRVVDSINDAETEEFLRAFAPDIMLSARFSLIFRRNVFDIPRYGTYNVHPGALPRYAGLFAPFRCMLEGGDSIGCTLHRVDDGIDTGPIIGIGWLPVDPSRSLLWHVVNTYGTGLELFFHMLDGLRRGEEPQPQIQDSSQRAYGSLPGAEAFAAFHQKGLKLFDPQEYMEILHGFVPEHSYSHIEAVAGAATDKVRASCCCAHA
ncbi:MAG: formyl transferase [Magnetospirillum sp.]